MKINKLCLNNFQGIKSAEFDFGGSDVTIYGDNATGKTTVFNSITWLLFGTPSTGAKNYTPKTKGPDGDLHNLEHSAEAEFELDDGRVVTLKKTFHENYKKKRGSATEEFDGHSVDFYIDGVPTKEKDYKEAVTSYCGSEQQMKMLTMPDYFSEYMSWDDRRKTLLEICGDISDDEVMASSQELAELSQLLVKPGSKVGQKYTVDEYKKIATARKQDINKKLASIPARIDEATRAKKETPDPDDLAQIEAHLAAQIDLMSNTSAGEAKNAEMSEKRIQLTEATERLAVAKKAHTEKFAAENAETNKRITALTQQKSERMVELSHILAESVRTEGEISSITEKRSKLLEEYKQAKAVTWNPESEVCPACGRPLPSEEVQRHIEEFNLKRSQTLEAINARGQKEASQQMIEEKQEELKKLINLGKELEMEIDDISQRVKELSDKLKTETPFEETSEYAEISAKISEIRAELARLGEDKANEDLSLKSALTDLKSQLAAVQEEKAQINLNASMDKRIAELEDEEKQLGADFEDAERSIYLCELFVKTKVKLLTDSINEKFSSVRFRLFVEQQNGGIKEDCEVMVPGEGGRMVPYSFANNAARINAGLEIIAALADHYNTSMPVVIDNAESVTHLLDIPAQTIRLVVSAEHDKLTMVTR